MQVYSLEGTHILEFSENQPFPQTQIPSTIHIKQLDKPKQRFGKTGSLKLQNILFPQFRILSITFPLSIIMFVYFWIIYIYKSNTDTLIGCIIYDVGGRFTSAIRYENHFHRLFASIILYADIVQCILCTITLNMVGYVAENSFGKAKFLFIMLINAINSNLMSSLLYNYNVGVSSYCIIYGSITIFEYQLYTILPDLADYKKFILAIQLMVIGLNLIPISYCKQLDFVSVICSIANSILFILIFHEKNEKYYKIKIVSICLILLQTILCFIFLYLIDIEKIDIHKYC